MMKFMLALTVVLLTLLLAMPAHADGLSAAAIAAPNSGAVLGAALSYKLCDHLWGDLGVKRGDSGTDPFLGGSTDLSTAVSLVGQLLDFSIGSIPETSRIGGAYDFRDNGFFLYYAQGFSF